MDTATHFYLMKQAAAYAFKQLHHMLLCEDSAASGRTPTRSLLDCVCGLRSDTYLSAGREIGIWRVYMRAADSGQLSRCGWVLAGDVSSCMICTAKFSLLWGLRKVHCISCGNVVCSRCCMKVPLLRDLAHVTDASLLKLCAQCDWEQEVRLLLLQHGIVVHCL